MKHSYWVVPGKLRAGSYPLLAPEEYSLPAEEGWGKWDDSRLQDLLSSGMRVFIDLTHEKDSLPPYGDLLERAAASRGIRAFYYRCPIVDESVPTRKGMKEILDAIDRAHAAGNPVYVHCWGGRGRTGVVAGCYLARRGATGEEALARIRELRRIESDLASPFNMQQREFVRGWRKGE